MLLFEKYEHLKVHNEVYNDKLQQNLKASKSCCLDQATGTGKTYQVFQVIHDMCIDYQSWGVSYPIQVLIVVPTDALAGIWSDELSFEENSKFYKSLKYSGEILSNSGDTSNKSGDSSFKYNSEKEPMQPVVDISFKYSVVNYDGLTSIAKIKKGKEFSKEDRQAFKSYLSQFDLIVFDEAHHISASTYLPLLECAKELNSTYVIGITATPRNEDGVNVRNYFNSSVHGISLVQAETGKFNKYDDDGNIVSADESEKLLPSFNIYRCIAFDKDLTLCRSIRMQYHKWFQSVAEAMSNKDSDKKQWQLIEDLIFDALDVEKFKSFADKKLIRPTKAIAFIPDGERFEAINNFISRAFSIKPSNIVKIDGTDSYNATMDKIHEFEDSKDSACLVSYKKLGEGLHISNVNCLIMLRATRSLTMYLQELGRIMSSDMVGTVIPVFDFAGNAEIITDLSEYDEQDELELVQYLKHVQEESDNDVDFNKVYGELRHFENVANQYMSKPEITKIDDIRKILRAKAGLISSLIRGHKDYSYDFIYTKAQQCISKENNDFEVEILREDLLTAIITYGKNIDDNPMYAMCKVKTELDGNFETMNAMYSFIEKELSLVEPKFKKLYQQKINTDIKYFSKFVNINESTKHIAKLLIEGVIKSCDIF